MKQLLNEWKQFLEESTIDTETIEYLRTLDDKALVYRAHTSSHGYVDVLTSEGSELLGSVTGLLDEIERLRKKLKDNLGSNPNKHTPQISPDFAHTLVQPNTKEHK
jgi:hypothetical protein